MWCSGSFTKQLESASFEWDPKQETALQQVPAAVQAALPLGQADPADPVMFVVTLADSDAA